jgi:glycosyltransferase involved in cell wall biosynthesis
LREGRLQGKDYRSLDPKTLALSHRDREIFSSLPSSMPAFETSLAVDAPSQSPSHGGETDRLRVLFIAGDFPPLSHSGTLRSEAFASRLPDFGVDPVIFTSHPDSAEQAPGVDSARLANWKDDQRWEAVYRVPWRTAARSAGPWRTLLERLPAANILAVQAERRRRISNLLGPAREAIRRHNVQAIYASVMPSDTVLLATQLADEVGLPVIADFRDPWSYHPPLRYRHFVDFWLERRVERTTLAKCSRVIVNTRQAQKLMEEKLGVPRGKLRLIRNGYDEREFQNAPAPAAPREPAHFVILHAGQLSLGAAERPGLRKRMKQCFGFDYSPLQIVAAARSPAFVLRAVETLLERHPEAIEQLRIRLVGVSHADRCDAIRRFRFPQCLQIEPRTDSAAAVEAMRRADLLLLLQFQYFLNGRDYCVAIPAKLYSYLRSGRRILACVQPSEIAELVAEHGAGRVVPPDDVSAIAAAVWAEYEAWLANDSRMAPPLRELPQYERSRLTGALAAVLQEAVGRPSANAGQGVA